MKTQKSRLPRVVAATAVIIAGLLVVRLIPARHGNPRATSTQTSQTTRTEGAPDSPASPPVEKTEDPQSPNSTAIPVLPSTATGQEADNNKRLPDMAKIEAFDRWLQNWSQASPDERTSMTAEGRQLAADRRAEFKALIATQPKLALEKSVRRVVRQDLPKDIVDELETPVSGKGDLNVYMARPQDGAAFDPGDLTLRYFESGGVSYKARVFGDLEHVTTRKGLPLQGVAVDREFAVAENAVRPLEVGERIPDGTVIRSQCPVSGKTSESVASGQAVTEESPTVEIAGNLITLCNGSHVSVLEDQFRVWVQASGAGGAGFFMDNFPGTSSKSIGNLRCLYIRVTYPEQMSAPNTEEDAYNDMTNVARYYLESSYGKMTTTTTVTPLVTLPHTMAWYKAKDAEVDGLGLIHTESRNEARKLGYDSSAYDCIIVRINGGPRLEGISWGGGSSVWITWGGMDVLNHECGHSLGRNHANYWSTTDGTAYGTGSNQEYGNSFDVMGGGGGFSAHYNTISKRALGWLPAEYVHQPAANGTYRIHAYDQPQLEEGKRYALTVAKDGIRQYNLEFHPARGGLLAESALVLYSGMGSNAGHLLDTTPGSVGGKNDGGIAVGRTFSDLEADQHFTVIGKNNTTPPSLDVVYNRGPFPGNVAPTATLAASATTINVGDSVTFTATASDANGDPLAYHWQFDDGVTGANSAVCTRSFSSAAQVNALLTVSDMKGGAVRRSVVINVGSHGRQSITGTITDGANPIAGVYVSNGTKYSFSNADGSYALAGLSTGSTTLTATLAGYTFTPSTANPYTVVAGTNTVNWTAAGGTMVTLAKTADPTEGGSNGNFRLTRTGDTSADLVVLVSPAGGTAVKTTDYTFTPDYATSGSYRSFTIPAGSATLDVAVAAVNDTSAEGPETITLQLASNSGYWSATANSVAMTLTDNDTTLPQVAVVSNDPYATENPADSASFTFTRTGSTASSLAVSVAWSGTATNGTDYPALPASVTIPAGQSSFTLPVIPLDDSAIEVPETIIATIGTNAAYVRDSSATTSTVVLTDDDAPVITVSVPDANASENGPDSGVFLVSRTGSTASPLTVYYGLHGSALHGTDYAPLTGEVVIPAGAASAPVVITPYNDSIGEGPETVVFAATTFNNAYSLGQTYQGTLTITDNSDLPVISVRAGSVGTEGGSNATFIVRAVGGGGGNVTVRYSVSGTATPGSDYTALSGTVSIPATGVSDSTVSIPILNDTEAESTETVAVTITPDPAYQINNDGKAEAIIRDNDTSDRVMVSTANQSPSESGTTGAFYFSRTGSTGALTVNYAVSGTATNGVDFTALPGSVVIPDGQTGVDLVMTPLDDTEVEGTETVTLTVLPGTGYGPDRPASATYEIIDSESPPITVGFQAATVTTRENDPSGEYRTIPVVLSAASADTITVNYTSSGGSSSGDDVDWAFVDDSNVAIPGGTLTFPPGSTSQNIRIRIKNDGVVEPVESAVLELRAARFASLASGLAKQTWLIFDENTDGVVIEERWSGGTVYTNQSWNSNTPGYAGVLYGFTPAQNVADSYSRRLTGRIVAPVTGTYQFWIASDDASRLYLSTDATAANKVQIASLSGYTSFQNWDANASQHSANITLTAGQSYYMEVQHQEGGGGDHVSVAWQGPNFSRTPITMSVPENTAPRFVRMAVSATTRSEADGSEPLLMALLDRPAGSTPVTVDYTVGGTATPGSDFTLSPGTLTFAPGEQVKPLNLSILADSIGETPESIVVSLANPSGAQITSPASHLITLRDSSAPAVDTLYATASSTMSAGTLVGTATATPASGRSIAGWAIVAGNTGGAFAIDSSGQVTLATPSALPNPGGMQLVVRASDNLGSTGDGLVNVICNAPANGVVEQRWSGNTAFDSNTWTATPSYSGTLATYTTPQNVADSYSRRLCGYIKPQVTGDYTFWIASDDDGRLLLSSDGSPNNKSQIAYVSGWTNYQAWDSQGNQKSSVIPLQAGKVYWMELQMKEGGGGDHASVAWQGPGISRQAIPSSVIFPYIAGVDFENPQTPPMIALTSPAEGSTYNSGQSLTLSAAVTAGSQSVSSVEFYSGGTLIGADSTEPYSIEWSNIPAGNQILTAKAVCPGGGVTSPGVSVSVTNTDPSADPDGDGFTTGLELVLGTNPYSSASQPPASFANLRAWWRLDETTGASADDSTGRPQDATLTGSTWGTGIDSGALTFDGSGGGAVGTSAALTGSGDFTLAAWLKAAPGSPGGTVIQQREPGSTGYQGEYMLNLNSDGTVGFFIYGTSSYQVNMNTSTTVNDGAWHHLAAVRSGSAVTLYIDGIAAATASGAIQPLQSRAVAIGYDHRDLNKRFVGSLDDIRIYERALAGTEVDALHDTLVPNRAPAFIADPVVKSATEDTPVTGILAGDTADPDFGDTLTFAKLSGPGWLTVNSDGTLSGTPSNSDVGPNAFTIRVSDNAGLTDDAVLNITVANTNDAPAFNEDPVNLAATEDSAFTGQLAATDIDAGDTSVFTKLSGPAWLNVASNGALSGTPGNNDVGANSFTVRVTDGSGATDDATLNISVANVNDAPAFTTDPINLAATEDSPFSGQLAAADVDAGETLTFTKISGPAWLAVSASGALTGTPANSHVGGNTFVVRVTDGTGATDDAALNITVANVNDAPVFTVDPILAASATEGVAYTGQSIAGTAADVDAGDAITYSKVSGPAWLGVASNGGLTGTPPSGSAGLNTFVVRATDGSGATDDAQLHITVAGLPLPWTSADIGTGMLAGSATHNAGTFTQAGSGALGGTTDQLRFTYQTLTGDGEIIARINSLQNTGTSSRVGVMIRDTMATNSRMIFMGLASSGNYRWARRTSTGGSVSTTNSSTGTVPNTWLRLTRAGNVITAYKSTNGTSWTTVGSTTVTLATNCYIGLTVSSGSSTTLNTSQFSNVSVTP